MKDQKKKNRIIQIVFAILFVLYLSSLMYLLFFSTLYGRGRILRPDFPIFSEENVRISTNIIPFKTIWDFISRLLEGSINTNIVITNILGNLIAFAPMGFFIPILLREKIDSLKKFTIVVGLTIILVEIFQFIFRVGSLDVDDLILNLLGAMLVYVIMTKTKIKKLVEKI